MATKDVKYIIVPNSGPNSEAKQQQVIDLLFNDKYGIFVANVAKDCVHYILVEMPPKSTIDIATPLPPGINPNAR